MQSKGDMKLHEAACSRSMSCSSVSAERGQLLIFGVHMKELL